MPAEDVAELMCVSVSSVYRYSQRYQATGDVRPFVKRNGPVGELCEHEKLLLLDLALAKPAFIYESYSKNCIAGRCTVLIHQQFAEPCIALE